MVDIIFTYHIFDADADKVQTRLSSKSSKKIANYSFAGKLLPFPPLFKVKGGETTNSKKWGVVIHEDASRTLLCS